MRPLGRPSPVQELRSGPRAREVGRARGHCHDAYLSAPHVEAYVTPRSRTVMSTHSAGWSTAQVPAVFSRGSRVTRRGQCCSRDTPLRSGTTHISRDSCLLRTSIHEPTPPADVRTPSTAASPGWRTSSSCVLPIGCWIWGVALDYAERLAGLGLSVTGVDISRTSLAYARRRARERGLRITYR